jgi:hypothetical protein
VCLVFTAGPYYSDCRSVVVHQTLNKHHQDACAVAYAYDGYIKAKLSVALEVLSDVKHVLKEALASTLISTRPRFSLRVCRRLMHTLQHSA